MLMHLRAEPPRKKRDVQEFIGDSSLAHPGIPIKNDQSAVHIERRRLMISFNGSGVKRDLNEGTYLEVFDVSGGGAWLMTSVE